MAEIIPAIGSCASRMTPGERRFAQRLQDKLENDYLCWYDVAIGDPPRYPDFVILHPGRGLLVLEVKDWHLDTIRSVNRQTFELLTERGNVHVEHPLEQARNCFFSIKSKLERDRQLISSSGNWTGKLAFAYGWGVVFSNITRRQFDRTDMREVLPSHLVICQDEMAESVGAAAFQERLWHMFPQRFPVKLGLPQIDRIRWHLFPEVRISSSDDASSAEDQRVEIPDVLAVMDLQQERLARSLGDGHRVIHGVAGSGKTMILGYRAERLARTCRRPILILCYNKPLAAKLSSVMHQKGLDLQVNVFTLHAWCLRQLHTYHVAPPSENLDRDTFFAACVNKVIRAVGLKQIPSEQYDAVLIDEAHDFQPEWFKLVVQMIHPDSNSLLVLYDDAQSIYAGTRKRKFSFSSVGIQAKGRTTILKLNYRNTTEILAVAKAFADELLSEDNAAEDEVPTIQPTSAGRHGPTPVLARLKTAQEEADYVTRRLLAAKGQGVDWKEMAVIYRYKDIGERIAESLRRSAIPFQFQQKATDSRSPTHSSVNLITMHSSKGLEFPLVLIAGIGARSRMANIEDEARLVYVAMTRATHELVMTHVTSSVISEKMHEAMVVATHLP